MPSRKTVPIAGRVSVRIRDEAGKIAQARGVGISAFVREVIEQAVLDELTGRSRGRR